MTPADRHRPNPAVPGPSTLVSEVTEKTVDEAVNERQSRLGYMVVASWAVADLPESRSALMSAAVQKEQDAFTDPDTDPAVVRYLSGDVRTLASAGPTVEGG